MGSSLKGNGYLKSKHAEESRLKRGTNRKSVSDQRTLKVRIKVGSENLSAQKNAEIYSGLGLVVSPSSSMEDSPTTSEGQCGKLLGVPEASPTSILQVILLLIFICKNFLFDFSFVNKSLKFSCFGAQADYDILFWRTASIPSIRGSDPSYRKKEVQGKK